MLFGAASIFRNAIQARNHSVADRQSETARARAALLTACFAVVKLSVETMLDRNQALTGAEIQAIFRQELEAELTRNLHDAYESASGRARSPRRQFPWPRHSGLRVGRIGRGR